jgi:transcriptional regulator with XRE-family HTH domain
MRSRFAAPALLLHMGEDVRAMFNKAVAVYFRELREGLGFTQESLAQAAGCGKRTVERIERNEGPVMPDSLERLMTVLGALPDEVNYLMTNKSATEAEARELAQALLQRDPAQRWRIALARDEHEALGRRLADVRLGAVHQQPHSSQAREANTSPASDRKCSAGSWQSRVCCTTR